MDTIRNYLENMFLGLPKTEAVERAKEELLSMMEDKYQELKEGGKSENEAIGIVISEFGNLDELADALGIKEDMDQKTEFSFLSYERAMEYIDDSKFIAPKTALGVWFCIMSPVILLSLLGLYEGNFINYREDILIAIGLVAVISMVAIGVSLFIRYSSQLDIYKDLQEEPFTLDYKTEQRVRSIQKEDEAIYISGVSTSVIFYILSALPIIITPLVTENEGFHIFGVVATLLIVAFSTYNIISKTAINEACRILLQVDEYKVENKSNTKYKKAVQIYWAIVVAAYLAYSFVSMDWHKSWIIWPVAGTLFAAVRAIFIK